MIVNDDLYCNTIVIRRPTGFSGLGTNYIVNLKEIQCWVDNVNILASNSDSLNSYFAVWTDKGNDIGYFPNSPANNIYNDIIEDSYGSASPTAYNNENIALIIKDISPTTINSIQSIVFYNRSDSPWNERAEGLAI